MNYTELFNYICIRKVLKAGILFTVLIATIIVTSANPLEKTSSSFNIESITSISNITDPHYYSLAKAAKIDVTQRVLDGAWSPDGSRLEVVSAFRPLGEVGLTAVYVLNADGTEMKEIASTPNNTRSKSIDMNMGYWNLDGTRIAIPAGVFRVGGGSIIANSDGTGFRMVGKNLTTIDSIRENILNIGWQGDFTWNSDGTAIVIMGTGTSFGNMKSQFYLVDKDGFILKQLTNESIETMVSNPILSCDRKKIAFNNFDYKNLWVMNEDGTELRLLLQEGVPMLLIGWSSDNSKIFYQVGKSVQAINVDGTDRVEITSRDDIGRGEYVFSSSQDRQKMIYTASTIIDGKEISKLYIADSDGSNQKSVLEVSGSRITKASLSPKGDKIAFIEDLNLYTIYPDGTGRTTIALSAYNYAWHPAGDSIAFSANIDKKTKTDVNHSRFWPKEDSYTRQVFMARPDGTERVQITSIDSNNYDLGGLNPDIVSRSDYKSGSWSPDSSRLLVESFDNKFEKMNLLVIKFSGYNEVMSLHVPLSVQLGEEFPIKVKYMSKPVENASITLNGKEIGITNETGHLNYSLKEPGRYLLNATKEGYRDASKLLMVKENTQISGQANITETAIPTPLDTPKTPGFNFVFPLIALIFIIILRRIR